MNQLTLHQLGLTNQLSTSSRDPNASHYNFDQSQRRGPDGAVVSRPSRGSQQNSNRPQLARPRGLSQQRLVSSAGMSNPFMLPSLGLRKHNQQLTNNFMGDPFKYHERSDMLLMQREQDRIQGDLEKPMQESLKVHEKQIATRQNRAGKIRSIKDIKYNKDFGRDNKKKGSHVDDQRDQAKNKINIFDEQESNQLKVENIQRLGLGDRAMAVYEGDEESQGSMAIEQAPNQLQYLAKHREQRESVKDFIDNSRKILMAQIAINDKTEETERLDEYIIMEEDKLKEAKNTFNEDKSKFEKYMNDLQEKATQTQEQVKGLLVEKDERIREANQKMGEIQQKKNEMKKIEEDLMVYRQQKEFLDGLAVYERRKKETQAPQKKVRNDGTTFITEGGTDSENFKIYFRQDEMKELLTTYEERNLTKIQQIQDDEENLDRMIKEKDQKVTQASKLVSDIDSNITKLQEHIDKANLNKYFLESNAQKQNQVESKAKDQKLPPLQEFMLQLTATQTGRDQLRLLERAIDQVMVVMHVDQKSHAAKKIVLIENLKKIEQKLLELIEKRGVYQGDAKYKVALEDQEKKLKQDRKKKQRDENQAKEEAKEAEKRRKNQQKIEKQERFRLPPGKRVKDRSSKPQVVRKVDNREKKTQEQLDYEKYLA